MALTVIPKLAAVVNDTDVTNTSAYINNFFVSGFTPSVVSNVIQVTSGVAVIEGHNVTEGASTYNIPFVASGAHVWLQLTKSGPSVTGAQYVSQSATPSDAIKICDYTDNGTQVTGVTDATNTIMTLTVKGAAGQYPMVVGTGAQLNVITTYAGMEAYCTTTGSGFTAGRGYKRNAANTAWAEFDIFENLTTGDILYASAARTLTRLAIGSTAQYLKVVGGIPAWAALGQPAGVITDNLTGLLYAGGITAEATPYLAGAGSVSWDNTVPNLKVIVTTAASDFAEWQNGVSYGYGSGSRTFQATMISSAATANAGDDIPFGFGNAANGASLLTSTNAAYFTCENGTLYGVTWAGGVQTALSLGASNEIASHVYKIVWQLNSAAFYVDGTLKGTNTTNVPTGSYPLRLQNVNSTGLHAARTVSYSAVSIT